MASTQNGLCENCGAPLRWGAFGDECPACVASGAGITERVEGMAVGAFELDAPLGRGAMGEVWLANTLVVNPVTGKPDQRALKFISGESSPVLMDALQQEALAASGLIHRHIVRVYSAQRLRGARGVEEIFIEMDLCHGVSLAEWLKSGAYRWEDVQPLAVQLLEGLGFAHRHGVVHRDLKPANLMVEEGDAVFGRRLRILDFGLASAVAAKSAIAGGTAPYMGPEQWAELPPHPTDDLYAVGVMLYQLVSGHLPVEPDPERVAAADPKVAWKEAATSRTPMPLNKRLELLGFDHRVPRTAEAAIMACLAKTRNHRPHSTADLARQLVLKEPAGFMKMAVAMSMMAAAVAGLWFGYIKPKSAEAAATAAADAAAAAAAAKAAAAKTNSAPVVTPPDSATQSTNGATQVVPVAGPFRLTLDATPWKVLSIAFAVHPPSTRVVPGSNGVWIIEDPALRYGRYTAVVSTARQKTPLVFDHTERTNQHSAALRPAFLQVSADTHTVGLELLNPNGRKLLQSTFFSPHLESGLSHFSPVTLAKNLFEPLLPGKIDVLLAKQGFYSRTQSVDLAEGTNFLMTTMQPDYRAIPGQTFMAGKPLVTMVWVGAGKGGFWASSTEITRAQFAWFTRADGLVDPGMVVVTANGWTTNATASWQEPGFRQDDEHPVVGVSWETAKRFCEWLTVEEQRLGRISARQRYRLPTDAQWEGLIPGGARAFENIAGIEAGEGWPKTWFDSRNTAHRDSAVFTERVSGRDTVSGILGNVSEWCDDPASMALQPEKFREELDAEAFAPDRRIVRGPSWKDGHPTDLDPQFRRTFPANQGAQWIGFRIVLSP